MPVTDDIVATVRAYLQAEQEEFQRLNAALDRSRDASIAYKAMIVASFIVAVQRKFSSQTSRDEIIDYVAAVRARGTDLPELLDPAASERMIASVFNEESTRDIAPRMKNDIQMFFATAIVNDEGLHGQDLEDFLAKARKLADDLIG